MTLDRLSEAMMAKARSSFVPIARVPMPESLTNLDYDRYSGIRFRSERAIWAEHLTLFRISPHHMGGLFGDHVKIHDVENFSDGSRRFLLSDFFDASGASLSEDDDDPVEVAGMRVHYPLNRPDFSDEVVSFLGASYFRALGRGNVYGASGRAVAINTGTTGAEEFPRFTDYYLQTPQDGDTQITILAALDGPSLTGAFQFVIAPGRTTDLAVTSRLFFRRDVAELGIAPLTSMFLFSPINRSQYNDFRPRVHDSEGLKIVGGNGETIWRPLNNPSKLANSYFGGSPRIYGLHQRSRELADFEDPVANYHLRPSVDVVTGEDWGKGSVRLVELPTRFETEDNIVAYWRPDAGAAAGQSLEHTYTLRWGFLPPDAEANEAFVGRTGGGHAGVSGSPDRANFRKFVIDFRGVRIGMLPSTTQLSTVPSISGGQVLNVALGKVPGTDAWRVVLDVMAEGSGPTEISLYLAGFGQKLSETWSYQWVAGG